MGSILGSAIIDGAAFTLQDSGNTQWSRDELFGYLNDGQRDLCLVLPNAYTVNRVVPLAAGTKQAVPADCAALVRLSCNMGTSGTVRGRAPRPFDIELMDRQNPLWHSAAASSTVQEYGKDVRDPKHYYVSPPQPSSNQGQVEAVFFGIPADLALETDPIVLDDLYKTALEHYVVYRAYSKEGEFSNPAGAMAHRAEFLSLLGVRQKEEGA